MKQTIKLRESELKRMIAESVRRVLRESKESEIQKKLYDFFDEYNWCDSNASYTDVFEDDEIPETAAKEFGLPVDYCIGIYHQFLEENPGYWDGLWEDDEEDEEMDESFKRKINRIVSECLKRNLR